MASKYTWVLSHSRERGVAVCLAFLQARLICSTCPRCLVSCEKKSRPRHAPALQPLDAAAGVEAVVVSTYQAASGAGQRAMDEMFDATRAVLDGRQAPAPSALAQPLAFNLFPHVDVFTEDGYTREEDKMLHEVRKILGRPTLAVDATCVRVPVARCHSESVSVRLSRELSVADARAIFAAAPGLVLEDDPSVPAYPTPLAYAHRDACGVGRVRAGRVFEPGLSFWIVGDQLRKGAALNAVQIAEAL